jgi:SAM-dependent methyltransferase
MPGQRFYDAVYRLGRAPWDIGPRAELVELVNGGRLTPCRAVDLGCGTGANAVFLAQRGFDVTGIDFSPVALAKATARADAAGVTVRYERGDLTALPDHLRPFDLLVDYGTLDDLGPAQRDRYVASVLPLAAPEARFLLWCFHWPPRWLDRRLRFMPIEPGEIERRFGAAFRIERIAGTGRPRMWRPIPGFAAYLMTKQPEATA